MPSHLPIRPALFRALGAVIPLLLCIAPQARAQAGFTAEKGADIFAFGGYSRVAPDYGQPHDTGYLLGGLFTRYIGHARYEPSLEFRYTHVSGDIVDQSTLSGGIRVGRTFRSRYQPYADFLIGRGTIRYVVPPIPDYPPDHGLMLSYGGGLNVDFLRNWSVFGDLQMQHWSLGENSVIKPDGSNYTLSPYTVSVGVRFRIPFHSEVGAAHSGYPREPKEHKPRNSPQPPPPPPSAQPAPAPEPASPETPSGSSSSAPADTSGTATPPQ